MKLSKKTGALMTALSVCAAMPLGTPMQASAAKAVSGDFNGDGKFGISDITGLMKASLNGAKFDARTLNATDADGNGKINLNDCILLLKQFVNGGSGSSSGSSGLAAGKDYAKGTTLRMGAGYNNDKTGITFDATTVKDKVNLADGRTYRAGDLKPTWQELQNRLGIKFDDKFRGNNFSKEFQIWQQQLDQVDIVSGTVTQFNEAGLYGSLVDLSKYLDRMPNFKAFLDANPIVRLSITGFDTNGKLGAIYSSPYYDGVNDIQRLPLMRTDWVEKLLNGSGEFKAEKCGTTAAPVYTPYMPTSGSVSVDVVKANGSGIEQISKNYNKFGNIIDKMNARGAMSGEEAVNMLREYIDKTYDGYYGDNRADLFIGQNAAWDADELVALLRCVVANAQTLNGTDTVSGVFCRQADNNQRRTDMYRFAGTLFGARGLNSTNEYLYVGSDGKLHDARTEEQTYSALERMHTLAQEGLIDKDFLQNGSMNSTEQVEHDNGFMSYDYNQNQTVVNEKVNNGTPVMNETEAYRAVMIPVARWYDGSDAKGKYMRFTDSWRSVTTNAWGISARGTADSKDKLNAALKLIDYYSYSKEGQILMSYGPDAFIDVKNPNGKTVKEKYNTFNLNGEEWPMIADAAYSDLWALCKGNYTDYSRRYVGSNICSIKTQSYEYQCTTQRGKLGAAYISRALAFGTIKHTMLSVTNNPWYTTVPTVLPLTPMEATEVVSCPELPATTSTSKFSTLYKANNLLVDIIVNGYSGNGTSSRAETLNTVKNTWHGDTVLSVYNTAWERLLNNV